MQTYHRRVQILQEVFAHIRECGDSSITRRSAGLPGLVHTVVAADAVQGQG